MRACANRLGLAFALAALPAAAVSESHSGLPPVAPAAIVAAAQSCSSAVTTDHLDEQRLRNDRWVLGNVSDHGRPADTPLRFFSRDSLMLINLSGEATCVILARLESRQDFATVRDGLTAAFGQPSRSDADGTTIWVLPEDRAAQLDPAGSREEPSVRIAVIHMSGNHQ